MTILIDWLHVAGYLWDATKALFCTDTTPGMDMARASVHEHSRMILHGDAGQVAERIRTRVLGRAYRPSAVPAVVESFATVVDGAVERTSGRPLRTSDGVQRTLHRLMTTEARRLLFLPQKEEVPVFVESLVAYINS